jgi:LacI family transcriptional regulator
LIAEPRAAWNDVVKKAPPTTPATISQVASHAGVSRATVSRAFTHPEMLRGETVALVKESARRLRYFPNQIARALSTGRHSNVALVVPDIANPFFPPLIRAAQARADMAGYCVFLGDSNENSTREDVLVGQFAAQVEGLVLVSSRLSKERIHANAQLRSIVLVNRDVKGIPRVLIDTASGIVAAVAHLAELGHRRIAYVGGPAASWSNQQRRQAIHQTARRLGLEIAAIPARLPTFEAGMRAAPLTVASGATAAVAFDDLVAQGLLAGLAECEVEVPRAFSVVGCDDVLSNTTYPRLTTVSGRSAEAGRLAVELLVEALRSRTIREMRCVLDTHLVVGMTTAERKHP